jgi:hypothetical protein
MFVYRIKQGSTGGFLCPPGHPAHRWHIEGFTSPHKRNADSFTRIDDPLKSPERYPDILPETVDRIRKMIDDADLIASEDWVKSVYQHFRTMYVPESRKWDAADDLISHSPAEIAVAVARKILDEAFAPLTRETEPTAEGKDPKNYRNGVPWLGRRRGYEITAKPDGSRVYVYALDDDGTRYSAAHLTEYADALADDLDGVEIKAHPEDSILDRVEADLPIVPEPIDPERHAAVVFIRRFFPDHVARLDLISNPGRGGQIPCIKCGARVQYEPSRDKWAQEAESGRNFNCPQGGDHAVDN